MHHSLENSILEIVLDDLRTNNAFDLKTAEELGKLLSNKKITMIVLRSQGRIFCSGGNLKDYAGLKSREEGIKVNRKIRAVLKKLAEHTALKVAYVSGDCFGGGIELISCCDLIYAQPHVFFGMWQRRKGLSFGWGGYERLSRRMNPAMAEEWILTGDVKPSFWAQSAGLLDAVLGAGEMKAHFERLTNKCLQDRDGSFRAIVHGIKKDEVKVFESLWGSEAHLEHLKKFVRR